MSRPWKPEEVRRLWDKTGGVSFEPLDPSAPQVDALIAAGWVRRCDGRCGFELLRDAMLAWTDTAKDVMASDFGKITHEVVK